VHPVSLDELTRITEIWVDTALQSGEKSLRMMERLVRAQLRRPEIQTTQGAAAEAAAESMGALR
jgi:DSF synthase